MRRTPLVVITLIAFAFRAHALGAVPLRWDEGWSIALATVPLPEMVRLTALDVHPPLFYLLLGPWLTLGGAGEFWARFLSVLVGTLAVPLAAAAAAAWWPPAGRSAGRAAVLAAAYACLAPALVYYSGVTRMYALTTPCLLLATWGLARLTSGRSTYGAAAAILGASAALYAFYYTGFALAGLFVAALVVRPRGWRRVLAVAAGVAIGYLPWLLYAAPVMLARVGGRTGGAFRLAPVAGLAGEGLCAALLCGPAGRAGAWVPLAVILVGTAVARPRLPVRLGLVVLPTLAVLVGAALGAQAHMFAARYAIVATPFLALGLGWALASLWSRGAWLGVAGGLALVAAAAPSLSGFVYEKTAEVGDAYDPATDWRELAPHTEPSDIVAFNILSQAGAYERYRTADDPPWTYAQLWDPVHEPLAVAEARLARAVVARSRLWLVLYRGIASADSAALKTWADASFYPGDGWWHDGTWYQGYIVAEPDREVALDAAFDHGVVLVAASYAARAAPGAGVAVALRWRADRRPDADARVFVHAYDPTGALVAQHDGLPAADTRPPTTWQPGEIIHDRHGLWIPAGTPGPLTLVVGLYDPGSGRRWLVAEGWDGVRVGVIGVR